MGKIDDPDTTRGESRPVRSAKRVPRKLRTAEANRVLGRSSATPTDMAREVLSPEVESGHAPTLDSPPPTRGGDRPVADRAAQAAAAVRGAGGFESAAPGEAEARAALADLSEDTGLSDEAELHVREARRRARIAEAAYYRAERRGFAAGGEEQDWLEAEAEIDRYDDEEDYAGRSGSPSG